MKYFGQIARTAMLAAALYGCASQKENDSLVSRPRFLDRPNFLTIMHEATTLPAQQLHDPSQVQDVGLENLIGMDNQNRNYARTAEILPLDNGSKVVLQFMYVKPVLKDEEQEKTPYLRLAFTDMAPWDATGLNYEVRKAQATQRMFMERGEVNELTFFFDCSNGIVDLYGKVISGKNIVEDGVQLGLPFSAEEQSILESIANNGMGILRARTAIKQLEESLDQEFDK